MLNLKTVINNKIFKTLLPIGLLVILLLIPIPFGMPHHSWRFLATFITMVFAIIIEPMPSSAIGLICVSISTAFAPWLIFSATELSNPNFNATKEAIAWGLSGFSSKTVWLVVAAFAFALGYETSGLGKRLALIVVKYMGKRSLILGYAIVLIDLILAPFMPSNTARTGGTVFPIIRNLPSIFNSLPDDPSSRKIGGYLMWMMVVSTSLSSSMFITGSAPNGLAIDFIEKFAHIQITWMHWFLAFLPSGIILFIIAPILSYYLYKPIITQNSEIYKWAQDELKKLNNLSFKEIRLIIVVTMSLALWIFGLKIIDTTTTALLALSLLLVGNVISWKQLLNNTSLWNTFINLATLITMANGLIKSGFIPWFTNYISSHFTGINPLIATIALVLLFYYIHYLFASLSAHTATMMPVILAIGKAIPGVNLTHLSILLALSIGMMGVLTPYATGPSLIIYSSGYIKSHDYWRLGAIIGFLYILILLLVSWPIMSLWI